MSVGGIESFIVHDWCEVHREYDVDFIFVIVMWFSLVITNYYLCAKIDIAEDADFIASIIIMCIVAAAATVFANFSVI